MKTINTESKDQRRMYSDLSWAWSIISPPEEYIEETELFAKTIGEHANEPVKTLLHMGCGAGGNDFTLKKYFQVTGVDLSDSMRELAAKLNPEVTYLPGDMRSVRLGQTFDAVTILDAIDYNRSEDDIRATFQTVYEHLEPGGVFLTVIEYDPATFTHNVTNVDVKKKDGIEVTFIENNYDPDTSDTTFEATFVFMVRRDGKLEIHTDRHIVGIYKPEVWIGLLKETGFEVKVLKFEHSSFEEGQSMPMLVGIKS